MLKFSLPGVLLCLPLAAGIMLQGGSCNDSKSNKNVSNMNQAQNSNAPVARKNLKGEWGGQGISMVVTETGVAFEFDCATGSISEVIVPNSDGKFSVKGLLARHRPGPTREGDDNEGQPAIYSGTVEGENLTLTITLVKDNEDAGTFKLAHGKPARIRRCG